MELSDSEVERLKEVARHVDDLRELIELVEEIKQFHRYRMAQRLIIQTGRTAIVTIGAVVGAAVIIVSNAKTVWAWFLNMGQ